MFQTTPVPADHLKTVPEGYTILDEGVNNMGIYVGEQDVIKVLEKTDEYRQDLEFYTSLPDALMKYLPNVIDISENETAYFLKMEKQAGDALSSYTHDLGYDEKLHIIEQVYTSLDDILLEALYLGYALLDLNSGNLFVCPDSYKVTGLVDVNRKYVVHVKESDHVYVREGLSRIFVDEAFSVLAQLDDEDVAWLQEILNEQTTPTLYLTGVDQARVDGLLKQSVLNASLMWKHVALWVDPFKSDVDVKWLSSLTDNKAFMQACFPLANEMLKWASPFKS